MSSSPQLIKFNSVLKIRVFRHREKTKLWKENKTCFPNQFLSQHVYEKKNRKKAREQEDFVDDTIKVIHSLASLSFYVLS